MQKTRVQSLSAVQSLSNVQLFATLWTAAQHASLSITNSWSLLKLMSIGPVMPSNHLILCRPLLLLPSVFPSIRVFSKESVLCIRWPEYWSFSFSISPSNEHPGLISFRMDWLDLLAIPGTLKSLLQCHSSKASILRHSAFFIVQLSYPYMTTGKTIALTRRTFVGKVRSLLFNMLSRLVIAFLPKSKCLLISWLQSPSAVILGPRKWSLSLFSLFPHLFAMKWWDHLVFWMLSFKPTFSLCALIFIKRLFSSSLFYAIRVVSAVYLRLLIFEVQSLVWEGPTWLGTTIAHWPQLWASLVVQMVKNLPAVWETRLQYLGQEDPLKKGTATQSSVLAWRIPWTEEPGSLQPVRLQSRTRLDD